MNIDNRITRTEFCFTVSLIFMFLVGLLIVLDSEPEKSSSMLKRMMLITAFVIHTVYFIAGWRERRKENRIANRKVEEILTK
ncbi:MAG: hypothetical protein AB1757_27845 [Acidobacteriota bacterium]